MIVDYQTVRNTRVAGEDTEGNHFEVEGTSITIIIPDPEADAILAAYDPSNQFSPPAASARETARVVLDALKRFKTP